MSNFAFFQAEWPELYDVCQRAESYAISDPNAAAFNARIAVEQIVEYLFNDVFGLPAPYRSDLNAMMSDPAFKTRTSVINNQLHFIRRQGNDAAHGGRRLSQRDSMQVLRSLFDATVWVVKHYSRIPETAPVGAAFDVDIAQKRSPLTPADLKQLAERFAEQRETAARAVAERDKHIAEQGAELVARDAEIEKLRAQIAAAQAADAVADTHDYREDETRTQLIDLLLHDAGWALAGERDREFQVTGMPIIPGKNESGAGVVDYVLWGNDGKPLGIVEAKRTNIDPSVGGTQAKLYADSLERQFGQRPIIFLSNGYQHQIWDDAAGYPPREVAGFYRQEELELQVQRRAFRKPLTGANADNTVAGRPYQLRAIAKVGEAFDGRQRRALLVMATGTGKTRTTIALVKLMFEQGWAKRVLFLADRSALVTQAGRNFSALLPDYATVNLTDDKTTEGRIYLSTYPTMMNLVDGARDDGSRRFGPGYFDFIIIDEAHRSVYKKYGALFDWFDGLLLGLTATPVDDIDRSTYRLFELESGVPTDSYPLSEAIADGYLVPPENWVYDYGFHREGIKYDELSEEDREKWDDIDWDEDDPDATITEVEAPRVFRSLFNADTADKALAEVMRNGLRVAGGDRLGKTIVFAMNQHHAVFLKERFDALNPNLGGDFAQVITSQSNYAQHLIDQFSAADKAPHVAISVDMLDTGIDVPEVLNLVLFKQVFSKTKFWQMVGRGTRLSAGIFGASGEPSDDKQAFRVFDFCGNIDYFAQDPADRATSAQKSLSHQLFTVRARLTSQIDLTGIGIETRDATVAWLHEFVASIPTESFLTRPYRERISKYAERDAWTQPLSTVEADDLASELGHLPNVSAGESEHAKRFDLIVLQRELAQLEGDVTLAERTQSRIQEVASQLLEKLTIPQVAAAAVLLEAITADDWWEDVTLGDLERVRLEVRSLVQFLDKKARKVIMVDWEDDLGEARVADLPLVAVGVDQKRFRAKVESYIREHTDHLTIQRLRRNMQLTPSDLSELERILIEQGEGTPKALAQMSGDRGLGIFVRSLVGLDREAVESAFAAQLSFGGFNATQMEFIKMVIDELTRRGEMRPERLFAEPYSEKSDLKFDIIFPPAEAQIVWDTVTAIEESAQPAA